MACRHPDHGWVRARHLVPDKAALTRSYVADDPLYFKGQYTGLDTVFVSEVPYLGTSYADRDIWLRTARWDPLFGSVRDDPRMLDLQRRMGL